MKNCKNCGNKIFEEKMGNFKCYLKERACVRSEIEFGCPDWSEKRAIKIEEKPVRVDGATFTPHITEDGIISWTNDQGLPNPKPVQLKGGEDGKDGYTPQKGVDYFTEADKQEIAEQAAELIDIPESSGVTSWNDLEDKPFYENNYEDVIYLSEGGTINLSAVSVELNRPITVGATYKIEISGASSMLGGSTVGWSTTAVGFSSVALSNFSASGWSAAMLTTGILSINFPYNSIFGRLTNCTVRIAEMVTEIKPLDEKYLPDSVVLKTDIPEVPTKLSEFENDVGFITKDDVPESSGGVTSWNDLEDKPFGESTVEQELVASTSITVPSSQGGTTKLWSAPISGFVPAVGERYTIEAIDAMTGTKLSTTAICEEEASTFLTNYKIGENTDTVYCYGSITSVSVYVNGKGYAGWRIGIYKEVATIKTLDEKYLPDSVALKTDIPEVPTKVSELENDAGFITKDDISGSSGGVTSWNDLEDKPFGAGKVEWKQIAFERETASINSLSSIVRNNMTLNVELGRKYRIVVRDAAMDSIRIEATVIATQVTSVTGNYISLGTKEDDIRGYQLMAGMPWEFPFKNPMSFPIGYDLIIYEAVETITHLDEKYLPDSVVLESELDAKGYQTEEQVTELINNALGVIENGTY